MCSLRYICAWKVRAFKHCIGIIDGTLVGVSRPARCQSQLVMYNGHRRKHVLKFQGLTTADGIIVHIYGPIEGHRHYWTISMRINLEEELPEWLAVKDTKYWVHEDSGYAWRLFLETPFHRSHLDPVQLASTKASSSEKITVQWVVKENKLFFSAVECNRKLRLIQSPV